MDLSSEINFFMANRNLYTREERKKIHQFFLNRISEDKNTKELMLLVP